MRENLDQLFLEISHCTKCLNKKRRNGRDCSLINFYTNPNLFSKIPSIWTDWYNRMNSNIMIIGQDWGPYQDMEKLNARYLEEETAENWKILIDSETSSTKKMLTKYLKESAYLESFPLRDDFLEDIYITNAIMCARKGSNYRGDNICLKYSTQSCSKYLRNQIEIIKPKVIVTLGYYPFFSLSLCYSLPMERTLNETIESQKMFFVGDTLILPIYHPTAQISREKQLEQYRKIWNYMKGNGYELKK